MHSEINYTIKESRYLLLALEAPLTVSFMPFTLFSCSNVSHRDKLEHFIVPELSMNKAIKLTYLPRSQDEE